MTPQTVAKWLDPENAEADLRGAKDRLQDLRYMIMALLKGDSNMAIPQLAFWLAAKKPGLDGKSPLEANAAGDLERLSSSATKFSLYTLAARPILREGVHTTRPPTVGGENSSRMTRGTPP